MTEEQQHRVNTIEVLLAMGVVSALVAALVLGPLLAPRPELGPEVRAPAMQNVPEPGPRQLSFEVQAAVSEQ